MKNRWILVLLTLVLGTAGFRPTADLPTKPEDISPVLIGEAIPANQSLINLEGKPVSLNELVGRKPTILIFYRGGWCPYCNLQLADLQTIEGNLKDLGYQVVAISPDRVEELQKTVTKNTLSYALLSDKGLAVAQQFGLVYRVADPRYQTLLEKATGQVDHLLPVPAVFVLNTKGVIEFEYINPNYKERLHATLLLTAAKLALE